MNHCINCEGTGNALKEALTFQGIRAMSMYGVVTCSWCSGRGVISGD